MVVTFFGTPEFALPSLRALAKSRHRLAGVVSAPDKPHGRGLTLMPPPVAVEAIRLRLPLQQPEKLRDPAFLATLRGWSADVFAVVAFRILPEEVFTLPRHGAINLHASLLPAYRGAAPIQWAIWRGERETGLTTFRIERTVDTGNILKQRRVEILDDDDAGSLSAKMAVEGAKLLVETLDELEAGVLTPRPQEGVPSPAPKIGKEHIPIDWRQPAAQIRNQVRALAPEPGAVTRFQGQTLKIFRTLVAENTDLESGEALIGDREIIVGAGEGALSILDLQLQGKNRMEAAAFLRGFRPRGRLHFENP